MSENYIRKCDVYFAYIGRTYTCDLDAIRVRFEIKQSTSHLPNIATIQLTNQLRELGKRLCEPSAEGSYVSISAGYLDNCALIFEGGIRQAMYGRENPTDTMTTVLVSDGGQGMNYAINAKTHGPGSTPKDHVDTAIAALKQFGLSLGFVGPKVDLSTPKYPRAVTLMGMAWKTLRDIARSKGATVSVQNSKVHFATPDDALPGGAFVLNSDTGLVGMPTLMTGGIFFRTLINPQMRIHALVKIDQGLIQGMFLETGPDGTPIPNAQMPPYAGADGIYRIFKVDVVADTRGLPWYQDCGCNVIGYQSAASVYAQGGPGNAPIDPVTQ